MSSLTKPMIEAAWKRRAELPRQTLRDGAGLSLVIGAESASWYFEYRLAGVHPETGERWPNRKLPLGRLAAEFHLADARKAAAQARAKVAQGNDPMVQLRTAIAENQQEVAEAELTVSVLLDRFKAKRGKTWRRASVSAFDSDAREIRAALGQRPIAQVTRKELARFVRGFFDAQEEKGRIGTRANRIAKLLGQLFGYAVEQEWIDVTPTQRLPKPAPEASRERALDAAELAAAWRALDDTRRPAGLALMISLATGQRYGAVTLARAAELDLDGRLAPDSDGRPVWRIPGDEGRKSDEPRVVPLSALAVNLWRQALLWPGRRPDAEFVFPGGRHVQRKAVAPMHPCVVSRVWIDLRKTGKVPADAVAHDLRRTARTWWSGLPHGEGRETMERLLGHVIGSKVERTYDRALHLPPQRRVADAWGDKLTTIARGGAEFATIRKGAKESERV